MRRIAIVSLVLLAAGTVASQDIVADETETLPVVDLFSRVPRRWVSEEADELLIESPRLLRSLPERCHTRGGYREHCQGVRDVPEPRGEALDRVRRLALGHRAVVLQLQHGEAFDEWIDVVRGVDHQKRMTFPVRGGRIGRGFGRTRSGLVADRRHNGVDIGAQEGTPIVAARGGLVVYSDDGLTGFGNSLMILHQDDTTTFYAHCKRTLVSAGEIVRRGTPIAEVGSTGFAENPHLHFEWRERGFPVDPEPMFLRSTR
jgi:hypothetical protein